MIITIDGYVATGKSTIAKRLAKAIGYIYYDTGAMYRAVTLEVMRKSVSLEDEEALKRFLNSFNFITKIKRGERTYLIGVEDVTDKIRSEEVSKHASVVSAHPLVREKLVSIQREHAKGVNAVFEGRDMGTVVFPDAQLKIFLTGRDEVRAKRRYDELVTKYPDECKSLTLTAVLDDLRKRDEYDSKRAISPLKQAEDAFSIDTSDLSPDEIVFKILECKDIAAAKKKKKTGETS